MKEKEIRCENENVYIDLRVNIIVEFEEVGEKVEDSGFENGKVKKMKKLKKRKLLDVLDVIEVDKVESKEIDNIWIFVKKKKKC